MAGRISILSCITRLIHPTLSSFSSAQLMLQVVINQNDHRDGKQRPPCLGPFLWCVPHLGVDSFSNKYFYEDMDMRGNRRHSHIYMEPCLHFRAGQVA